MSGTLKDNDSLLLSRPQNWPGIMQAQRRHFWRHRKLSIKKLSLALAGALLLILVLTISIGAERVANRLVLYVRVARLYTQDPPRRIKMPLQDVPKKQVANTWHAPRGANRLHEGQDIFAPRGTPIYSATNGYVYNIGENGLGGQTVSVVGSGGRFYYYAHLDSYAPRLEEGDSVTTQTLLGYVGTTGNAQGTPPHLHFGIYTPGGAINPLPLLSDRAEKKTANNQVRAKGKSKRG
ncbi:MAG: M23 family metallopeptidase [Pyrinomonadaceae bacterium]